ncbi:hypothetical protein CPB84DRAFT_1766412 [Gymnopilus junonius]|uniref:Uncharacterized protein n=1 Tax=Gymnopilus junonius TaxID=109634 RepID=A0A9P5TS89_GYMJU|nr:hypothetical protein CPB84DRAFT_1766412 [Gymnopilus junonius]
MHWTRALAFTSSLLRNTPKYPRPRPGTAERPAYHAKDPLIDNPKAVVTKLEDEHLTFIHRPPPTAPSPFSLTTAPASPLLRPPTTPYDGPLPPLSRSGPSSRPLALKYSRGRLARMFKCTQTFVGLVAPLKKALRKTLLKDRDAKHELARQKWSEKHSLVKAISKKRRELW